MQKKKIILVDDHAMIRQGISRLLEETKEFEVVAEVGDFYSLRQALGKCEFDLAIVDISLKEENGLDIIKWMQKQDASKPVLVFSRHPEEHYAIRAKQAGAQGYLTKESPPMDLIEAIRVIFKGETFFSESVQKQLNLLGKVQKKELCQLLSDREFEILCLIGGGMTLKSIADQIGISDNTAYTYRSRILQKLDLSSTNQLIYFVLENKLI